MSYPPLSVMHIPVRPLEKPKVGHRNSQGKVRPTLQEVGGAQKASRRS
jgi:hypothetical protein